MKPGTCIHFNGLINDTCKATHSYLDVASPLTQKDIDWHNENYPHTDVVRTGISHRVPCFAKNGLSTCPDFREPTVEEMKADEAMIGRMLNQVMITRKAIVDYCEQNKLPRGTSGKIPCPVCQTGEVQFSRAGYNGHIHARCSTPHCVQWME